MEKRIEVLLVTLCLVAGCGVSPSDQLRARSAFDLGCPKEQLQLADLDGKGGVVLGGEATDYAKTVGVSGCGKQATYVKLPDGTWAKNAETTNSGK